MDQEGCDGLERIGGKRGVERGGTGRDIGTIKWRVERIGGKMGVGVGGTERIGGLKSCKQNGGGGGAEREGVERGEGRGNVVQR